MVEHNPLFKELESVIGGEGYKEIFSSVSIASLKGAKFITGKTADAFKDVFTSASKELIKTLGTNKMKIGQAEKQAKQHHPALFFSSDVLKKISTSGGADTLVKDASNLTEALKEVKSVILETQALNEKQLAYFKKYKGIKKTGDAISVIHSLDELKFPSPKFPHKENVMLVTNILPRDRVFKYNTETHHFDIVSKQSAEESTHNALPSDDVTQLLREVEKLNDIYSVVAKANQEYVTFLKKFNIVIKESFDHLDKIEDELSPSVKRDLMSRLEGDKNVFGFYTGFLPKVVNYVDEYINVLTSYLISKTN